MLEGVEGVEEVLVDQGTGVVQVRCTDGVELNEQVVAAAVESDPKFEVTEFTMEPAAEPAGE